jgi:sialate O-acetylesterase
MPRAFFTGILLMLLSPLPASPAGPSPWLPAILGDHMVVQQGRPIPLWGRDLPGTPIRASMNGASASANAGSDGSWQLLLPPLPTGGPYDLVIAGSVSRTVADVLVGEVWLGSGQSNTELALRATKDRDSEIPAATDSQIRFFNADHKAAFNALDDLQGTWIVCSPEAAKGFSGVAYHFAKALRQTLKAPLGMIVSCWGGTSAEAWVPRAGLDQESSLAPLLKAWDEDQERHALWADGEPFDLKVSNLRFSAPPKEGRTWPVALGQPSPGSLGGAWSHSEKPDSSGAYESSREDAVMIGRYHGTIKGGAWGSAIGQLQGGASVDLSAADSIDLRVKGVGRFIVTLGQPSISDYDNYASEAFRLTGDWQDLHIPLSTLKQGGWGEPKPFSPQALTSINFSLQVPYWPDLGAVAYNGMIAPLTHTPIQGVLWYQGESNAGRDQQYRVLLGRLMQSWRQAWGQDSLPFLVVQLPNYADAYHWGPLREAQRLACAQDPHCSLTSTLDVGESHNIHPKDKKTVGERLAAAALAQVYGKKVGALSPSLRWAKCQGSKVTLSFDNVVGPLQALGSGSSGGVELAGADGAFQPAEIEVHGDQVTAWNREVPSPKIVRHAWADDPPAYLGTLAGPPVPSFEQSLP